MCCLCVKQLSSEDDAGNLDVSLTATDKKADEQSGEAWQSDSETEHVHRQELSVDSCTYRVGDFVYVEPSESNLKPHIVCIERLWEDGAGESLLCGGRKHVECPHVHVASPSVPCVSLLCV